MPDLPGTICRRTSIGTLFLAFFALLKFMQPVDMLAYYGCLSRHFLFRRPLDRSNAFVSHDVTGSQPICKLWRKGLSRQGQRQLSRCSGKNFQ